MVDWLCNNSSKSSCRNNGSSVVLDGNCNNVSAAITTIDPCSCNLEDDDNIIDIGNNVGMVCNNHNSNGVDTLLEEDDDNNKDGKDVQAFPKHIWVGQRLDSPPACTISIVLLLL